MVWNIILQSFICQNPQHFIQSIHMPSVSSEQPRDQLCLAKIFKVFPFTNIGASFKTRSTFPYILPSVIALAKKDDAVSRMIEAISLHWNFLLQF